jgi:hypothetical protein
MKLSDMRRVLLRLFIIFLCLSAGVAIIAIMGGGFGEIQLKIIFSTLAIAAANICGMSCAACIQTRGPNAHGVAGIVCSMAAAVMVLAGIWCEVSFAAFWRIAMTLIVLSVALAHSCALRVPQLRPQYRWIQTAGIVCAAVLATFVLAMIWADVEGETLSRSMAVIAILGVLFSLIVPILSRFKDRSSVAPVPQAATPPSRLVLDFVSPGLYRDQSGRSYHVNPVGPPEDLIEQ